MSLQLTVFLACFFGDGYPAGVANECRDILFEADTVIECSGSPADEDPLDANPNTQINGNMLMLSTLVTGEQEVLWRAPYDSRGFSIAPIPARAIYVLNIGQEDLLFRDSTEACVCHTRVSNGCPVDPP